MVCNKWITNWIYLCTYVPHYNWHSFVYWFISASGIYVTSYSTRKCKFSLHVGLIFGRIKGPPCDPLWRDILFIMNNCVQCKWQPVGGAVYAILNQWWLFSARADHELYHELLLALFVAIRVPVAFLLRHGICYGWTTKAKRGFKVVLGCLWILLGLFLQYNRYWRNVTFQYIALNYDRFWDGLLSV